MVGAYLTQTCSSHRPHRELGKDILNLVPKHGEVLGNALCHIILYESDKHIKCDR